MGVKGMMVGGGRVAISRLMMAGEGVRDWGECLMVGEDARGGGGGVGSEPEVSRAG